MAEDDQRDGRPVTPDVPGTTSTSRTAPSNRTPGDRSTPGDSRNARRPVRSAPIRRGRGANKAAPKPTAPVESVEESVAGGAGPEVPVVPESTAPAEPVIAAEPKSGSAVPAASESGAEPDPSEVEKTVSYRERRRARTAGKPTGSGKAAKAGSKRGIRYRGSGRRSPRAVIGVVVSIVVIVVCAVASVVFALGVSRQDELNDLRAEYSTFASQVLVNLTSMNPDNVDKTLTSVQEDTSGKVKQEVQNNIQQVAELVRDGKLETRSLILSSAVTKAEPDEGSVIMVFGWNQRSLDGEVPSQEKVFRWRVDMTRINGDLKMTDFEWVA
ncbi:hypothetical protein [Gordonia jinghuaiqii]|uniref:hypothetical protein n=1 Tax=Gordonia jinghuaiqii TaxID=2758710 RepID=UPI001FD4EC82|nr:hypothetical protein [Gordonia jinghuaiqii]